MPGLEHFIKAVPVLCSRTDSIASFANDIGFFLKDMTYEEMRVFRNALVDYEPPTEQLRHIISAMVDMIDGYRARLDPNSFRAQAQPK